MMHCRNCDCEIPDNQVRWAYEDPYCEDCFYERYEYCHHCEEVISREETHWDSAGNPYCSSCYEEGYDDDSPDNPAVYDSDRKMVLQLARDWLSGKNHHRTPIKINTNDAFLQKLRDMTGLVDVPIYVFGLLDRDEYQISASPNFIEQVREYIILNGINARIIEGIGCNRLGISYSLRKDHLHSISNLIKYVAQIKETVTV